MSLASLNWWSLWHSVLLLIGLGFAILLKENLPLLLAGLLGFAGLFLFIQTSFKFSSPNLVSAGRFLLIAAGSWFFSELNAYVFVAVVCLATALDGLDGYLARRFKQETEFGRLFDLEVDAFLVLVLCYLLYSKDASLTYLFVAAIARPIFVFLMIAGFKQYEEPHNKRGQTVFVIVLTALIVAFILPPAVYQWLLPAATLLLLISFAIDISRMFRNNHVER